jgi:flagellar motility protein MotE (MotC chaperone)
MPKLVKVFLFVIFPLFLVLGGAYGLAKVGVIPIRQVAAKNHALGLALHLIGLDTPKLPSVHVTPASAVAPDPLDSQRRALAAQRSALDKERADWDVQRQAQVKTAAVKTVTEQAVADPKSIARLAAIYEQMPAETANKIFSKLPDPEVIALLRKMDEKKVSQILAIVPPDRAARMTLSLSKPAETAAPPPGTE